MSALFIKIFYEKNNNYSNNGGHGSDFKRLYI